MSLSCSICNERPIHRGVVCRRCATWDCDRHGAYVLPLLCGGVLVCSECHNRDGCPLGDEDGCCASCSQPVDCQRGAQHGLCGGCAVADGGA